MTISESRSIRTVLIPWVMALVALVGLNAIAQDFPQSRKKDSTGETGISQLADNPQAPGKISNPMIFVGPRSTCLTTVPSSCFLRVEVLRDQPLLQSVGGAVHGRAPPAGTFA